MKPFFSVIIPVYNAENTIQECLNSVLAQTFGDYEIVITDDGSHDNSGKIIKQWRESNPEINITLIEQGNKGLGAARNSAVKHASGEFISLLDADDLWKKEKLQLTHEYLERNSAVQILYHQAIGFGLRTRKVRHCRPIDNITDILKNGSPIVPSTVTMKRELALQYSFPEEENFRIAEDIYLWLELLGAKTQFHYLAKPLAFYREEGGISTDIGPHLKSVFHVFDHFHKKGYYNQMILNMAKRRKYYEAARFYHKRRKFARAREFYKKAGITSLKTICFRLVNAARLSI